MGACQSSRENDAIISVGGKGGGGSYKAGKCLAVTASAQLAGCFNDYQISAAPSSSCCLSGNCKPDEEVPEDQICEGRLTITLSKDAQADWYFDDGKYNCSEYPVDAHTLTFEGKTYPTFKIHPCKTKQLEHLVTSNFPMYKFDEPCKVFKFDGVTTYECIAEIKETGWQKIPLSIEKMEKPVTLIFTPCDMELSVYQWTKKDGCKKACVFKNNNFQICKTVYDVAGMPYTPEHFLDGPDTFANRYGD